MQCLSPKSTGFNEFSSNITTAVGEGSGTPTEPHHTPSPEAQQSPLTAPSSPLLPPATTETIPTSTPTEIPKLRQYSRRARIAQSLTLTTATDEPASPLGDDSQGEACPTVSGLEARQDRANIIKTSALPDDSTPRVTSLAADEGSMKQQLNELTDLCAEPSREDASIKGRSLETGEEAGVERSTKKASNDTKELVNVLTSFDAANILTSGVQVVSVPHGAKVSTVGIPTGSGLVPTASPIFSTASVVTPYSRHKEQMAREHQRKSEQIARDAEIARIHAEEELQMLIDGLDRNNEVIARHLHEYEQAAAEQTIGEKIDLINELVEYQDHHSKILEYQAQQSKPLSKKQQREFYMSVLKSHSRWKTKHFKEQESPKKIKTSEEVSQEDLKEMMQLVLVEEVYVEALQVKHPIIYWEIHSEGQRNYWKIIRLGGSTSVYQFFVDMLKHFNREDLIQLWTLVKETFSIRQATSDKEKELWVELKRDQEIFMLVEKDYPLRKGLAIVMISNKLQVENYSQMANDLILKIHNIVNSIPTGIDDFPLPDYFPTASEDRFPLQSERDATAEEVCTADEVKD
uniref:Synaptobrevin, longin-like domain protein n=1 Tax=Tanacetum cinerariifolium TaxID=118510 RepID=A0A699J9B6_TANCI|nr:hypothetical protein [Tanacetum cinerariifolium]